MKSPLNAHYLPIRLPEPPLAADLRGVAESYTAMIVTQFRAILERSEAGPLHPWLDTRLDLNTGADLPADDPRTASGLISGWVQGRGLESLAVFGGWLEPWTADPEAAALLGRVRALTAALLAQFRAVRARHGGHLHFTMLPDGLPVVVDAQGRRLRVALGADAPYNFSDLFGAKGMFAAAHFLRAEMALEESRAYCLAVYDAILAGRFVTDQPQPPGLAAVAAPDAVPHGSYMIALGLAAHFARYEPGAASTEMGLRLARRVLYAHVNLHHRWPALRQYDLVEFIRSDGAAFADEAGRVIADPGHALEFVGLFLKFSAAVRAGGGANPQQQGELAHMEKLMPAILARAFETGYRADVDGITKSVDLLTRRPIDPTLPWWSLPETIRAGLAATAICPTEEERAVCRAIVGLAHNAFVEHYVRPEVHLMAVKLRDAEGRVSDLIPAYPDADPGYHTALSLIDALALL